MRGAIPKLLMAVLSTALLSTAAHATDIPAGFVSYDVTGTNVAEFDIFNFTGANASTFPDTTFPISTDLSLSDLSLTVNYGDGSSMVFGPSYFTLDPDGLSFDGEQLSTLSGSPTGLFGADSFTLTGVFSTTGVTLNDGSMASILENFSATVQDPGGLSDGDFAVINASETPEPATWVLLATGLLMAFAWRVRPWRLLARGGGSTIALGLGVLSILLCGMKAEAATVKLNAVTSPSSGSAGTSTVSVTGTGFPTGAINPGSVVVSLASTCGGPPTTATATAVQSIIGTSDRISFAIPGSLAAGSYFVSVSGTSESAVSFTSGSSCSAVSVVGGPSPTLSIDTSNPTDWVIKNGALTIDYNSTTGAVWSIIPAGTQDQLVDFDPGNATVNGSVYDPADGESAITATPLPTGWNGPTGGGFDSSGNPVTWPAVSEPKGFYMDLAGFSTAGVEQSGYSLTADYLDFWIAYPAYATMGTTRTTVTNATEYEEHFVVTPNDPGVHIYFSLNHPAMVPVGIGGTTYVANSSGTIGGQVQWIWRDSLAELTHMYHADADLSMVNPVITPLLPVDDMFSSDPGREVQDASGFSTLDLHPQVGVTNEFSPYPSPGGIPQDYSRNYYVKYSFGGYEYLHKAHGLFGDKYGVWAVVGAGHDTFVYGPQKQNLFFTGNILTIEPLSSHYTYGMATGAGSTSIPASEAMTRLFGPVYVRINHVGMTTTSAIDGGTIRTPDDMYQDAVAAGASFTNFYNNEAVLVSKGYVPTTQRGSVSIQVSGVAGAPKTAWVVLSDPSVNQQYTDMGYDYWADISSTGSVIVPNVVPGTYRLSVYVLGKWGEYRQDGVVVSAGNTTNVAPITFQPENFGTVVGAIGTPDRSAHEFLHGAFTTNKPDAPLGYDDRDFWGAWNYWADFATNPTNTVAPGAVVYNLTDGPNGPATNNPLAWNYTHWAVFDPPIYGGAYVSSDDTTDGYKYLIPAYVSGLPGASGTNGVTTPVPPWQIHFATPSGASSKAYVDLSVALAMAQSTYTMTLNGSSSLAWTNSRGNASDSSERSGLSGFTEWVVFQWPTSALKPEGQDNVITIGVSGTSPQTEGGKVQGVANNSDDALRLELSNGGADPGVTGWQDYYFVTSGNTITPNDTVPNP
ncbi:MAG TPA: polysaccharide lyase family protein [Acidobacteriaceae bacterium]|nr:polysaccharide lyase family protein [Acidobacteriaceae bacterium]